MQKDTYIRFDWAIKRMLRDKANFGVLEGLMTVLLGDQTKIVEILESEGNQLTETDKFNRVDIKAKNSKGEIIIVEVQNTREIHYLERILGRGSKDHHRTHQLGRQLQGGEEGVFHQHRVFRFGERKRLSLPRTEPLHWGTHPRRADHHHEAEGCHRAEAAQGKSFRSISSSG